jgi:hypothetical protein
MKGVSNYKVITLDLVNGMTMEEQLLKYGIPLNVFLTKKIKDVSLRQRIIKVYTVERWLSEYFSIKIILNKNEEIYLPARAINYIVRRTLFPERSVKAIVTALFSAGWEPEKHKIKGILIDSVPESADLQSSNCSLH